MKTFEKTQNHMETNSYQQAASFCAVTMFPSPARTVRCFSTRLTKSHESFPTGLDSSSAYLQSIYFS